jgi:hypothetical protein
VDDAHRCYIAADALVGSGLDGDHYRVRKWLESSREIPIGQAALILDEVDRKRSYREANIPGIGHLIFKLRPDAKDPTRHTLCRVYRVEE